jgi:hypothetical protein
MLPRGVNPDEQNQSGQRQTKGCHVFDHGVFGTEIGEKQLLGDRRRNECGDQNASAKGKKGGIKGLFLHGVNSCIAC